MSWEIEREQVGNGYELVTCADELAESPRKWDNLGHMITWGTRLISPDENPYEDFEDFAAEMLQEFYTAAELRAMVEEGAVPSLRIGRDEEGNERIEERYPRGWDDSYSDWDPRDGEDLQREFLSYAIAEQTGAAKLAGKMEILPVYRFEHSCVRYSTRDFRDPWDSGMVGVIYATPGDANRWFGEGEALSAEQVRAQLAREVDCYSEWADGDVYMLSIERGGEVIDCVAGVYESDLEDVKSDLMANAA